MRKKEMSSQFLTSRNLLGHYTLWIFPLLLAYHTNAKWVSAEFLLSQFASKSPILHPPLTPYIIDTSFPKLKMTTKAKKTTKNLPKTMEKLLEKTGYKIPIFSYGDIVRGKIISITRREILVDLKAKSEGIIAGRELSENPELFKNLKVGDEVLAFVITAENDQGYIVLSLKRALPEQRWQELEELFEKDESLTVKVIEYNRGGFLVDAKGVVGFIPMSHLKREHLGGILPIGNLGDKALEERVQSLIGRELTVKIIEMYRTQNRLVFSEKEALSKDDRQKLEKALKALKVGEVLEGVVTGVLLFGVFVELKGKGKLKQVLKNLEGLVHVSEIAWEKVFHPRELYKVGDKVKVKVLEVDPELFKVALSIKQAMPNPWDKAAEKYKAGMTISGKVTKVVPFGAFVRLEPGLDGLVHVSETVGPLRVGEKVKAVVLEVSPAEQRLALSIKKFRSRS